MSLIDVGLDVLKTVIDVTTKSILAQLGDVLAERTDSENAEWWQHVGFLSRPPKPAAKTAAAQVVVYRRTDHDVVIASRDLRGQALAGSLGDGETCIYAAGPDGSAQGRVLLKGDGSVTVYTTSSNGAGGNSIAFQVGPNGISAGTPWGAVTLNSDGFTVAVTGGAGLKIGTDGKVALMGQQAALNAGSVLLGASASPVTPAVWGLTGISGVASTSVYVSL